MSETRGFRPAPETDADVEIITSGLRRIPAHSSVLASASPVMESKLLRRPPRKEGDSRKVIRIRGVADDAVAAFIRLLYTGRCTKEEEEEIGRYAMHLLVLSHVYQVSWLKCSCQAALASRLTTDTVVDVLQLAQQCDAPRLYLRCMKLVAKEFTAVEKTEAWCFLRETDPWQELEILQFLRDTDLRRKRWRRRRAEQGVYMELKDAMDCLQHICTEGCTEVGPLGGAPAGSPCARFATCHGLQQLIRHFSRCHRKSCTRCQRMWQLLRLHSALCDQPDRCNTPLCKQFKRKTQEKERLHDDDDKWQLLAKKVMAARVMSSLVKRKQIGSI